MHIEAIALGGWNTEDDEVIPQRILMSQPNTPWCGAMVSLPSAAPSESVRTAPSGAGMLQRSPSLCSFLLGATALIGSALLSACGGGGGSALEAAPGTPQPPAGVAEAPRTAPAIPVVPQPRYAASGPNSYQSALTQYNQVGEALHGQ